ncbi:hypothetical protein NC653_030057 [Populus alba x Populus x berolinensis]|uniref:Uncharacterized protein n=1 Tax=Populus alba x Populus x berolinensis TaxID=444605 RepID=A0AAD6M482_9ROSI|nr:hypothetical protein NC653_030057 [Populus alba x Populus x berolinensis]
MGLSSSSSTKPSKEKTTKAERRALQDAQRAAKAAAKAKTESEAVSTSKPVKAVSQCRRKMLHHLHLQLQLLIGKEVNALWKKRGGKISLHHECNLMTEVVWKRLKSVQWSIKVKLGIGLSCFDTYRSMNMELSILILSRNFFPT